MILFQRNSKLGVPIKTSVSASILEEALNGRVSVDPLLLGQAVTKKVSYCCRCLAMISFSYVTMAYLHVSLTCAMVSNRLKSNVHTFMPSG